MRLGWKVGSREEHRLVLLRVRRGVVGAVEGVVERCRLMYVGGVALGRHGAVVDK